MKARLLATGICTLLFLLGCSTSHKTTAGKPIALNNLIRGKDVNLYWLDKYSDFSHYASIQLPDFTDCHDKTELAWINSAIPERVSTWFSDWKLIGIIDRSPKESMPWTDLVLRGVITDVQMNTTMRSQIAIECTLYDVRHRKDVCIIKHQRFLYSGPIDSSNPLEILTEQISDDIARFLKDVVEDRVPSTTQGD